MPPGAASHRISASRRRQSRVPEPGRSRPSQEGPRMTIRQLVAVLLGFTALLEIAIPVRAQFAPTATGFGAPLPDLPAPLLSAFEEGRQRFAAEETVATGLGPLFNARSCAACHAVPD